MTSRDIEGGNPRYLPQTKVYNQCCGIGPWISLADSFPQRDSLGIHLTIRRRGEIVFQGTTNVERLVRSLENLVDRLGRDNSFPCGAVWFTGTGIVPDASFTLRPNDIVDTTVDGVGTLSNPIVQG